jgi:hypothetical protein
MSDTMTKSSFSIRVLEIPHVDKRVPIVKVEVVVYEKDIQFDVEDYDYHNLNSLFDRYMTIHYFNHSRQWKNFARYPIQKVSSTNIDLRYARTYEILPNTIEAEVFCSLAGT